MAIRPTCAPLLLLSPTLERSGPPGGRGYLPTYLTCGPLVIPSFTLKRWGPLGEAAGVMQPPGPLMANSDCVPRFKALGTPMQQGLCRHLAHLWATSYSVSLFQALGMPPNRQG